MRDKPGKFLGAAFASLTVLGAAACSGSSSPSQTQAGVQPDASSSVGAGASGSTAASVPASSRATSASSPGAGGGTASAAATGGSTSGAGTTAKPPGKPTGFTRPGTYTYDLSGSAKQPIGGTQTISGTQSYVVDRPSGSDQHSKTSGQQGSQDMTLRVLSSGLYVVDIHISQQGFDEDFRPTGTALYFPASYHTGSAWSWKAKSTDGKYAIAVSSKVSGTSSVTVAGSAQKALIVDSTLHITGNGVDITSQQRDWVSTTYALILKEHSVTNGSAFGATFNSDVTRQIKSTTPS